MPISFGNNGQAGQDGGVTPADKVLLSHITYNETKDRVISDRPFETTLDSLYLGEQHIISSGSDNIFYTNANTLTAWSACWSGLRNQALPSNQGMDGVYVPQGRTYSKDRADVLPWGVASSTPGENVTFNTSFVFNKNNSITGITVIAGEEILPTDYLFFHVHYDDHEGIETYEQLIKGKTVAVDDVLTWDFNHPVEEYHTLTYFMEVYIAPSRNGTKRRLLVRRSASTPTEPGFTFHARTFLDRHISVGITQVASPTYDVTYASQFAVDTTTNAVAITNPSTSTNTKTAYFRVFDAEGTFHINSCTVTVGSPAITMTLDAKGDDFTFYVKNEGTHYGDGTGFGAIWYYYNTSTGKSGLVTATNSFITNTLIGSNAGTLLTTGIDNTLVGGLSGNTLTTGNNNILIGKGVVTSSAIASNETVIGNASTTLCKLEGVITGDGSGLTNIGVGPTEWATNEAQRSPTLHLLNLNGLSDMYGDYIYFGADPLEQLLITASLDTQFPD